MYESSSAAVAPSASSATPSAPAATNRNNSLSIDGFLTFYYNAAMKDVSSVWNDLLLFNVNPQNLSFPGSIKSTKDNANDIANDISNDISNESNNKTIGIMMELPTGCREALVLTSFLTKILSSTPIWLSSNLLNNVIRYGGNRYITSRLIPTLVSNKRTLFRKM